MYSGHWLFGSYVPSDALNASMVPIATCLFRVSDLRRRTGSDNLDELGKVLLPEPENMSGGVLMRVGLLGVEINAVFASSWKELSSRATHSNI
jgi:hypothetical protein